MKGRVLFTAKKANTQRDALVKAVQKGADLAAVGLAATTRDLGTAIAVTQPTLLAGVVVPGVKLREARLTAATMTGADLQ